MPFYEYECPSCHHHGEALQKISDPPLKTCPNCGKRGYKRLVSAPVFRLKGSGWYETDFKSDKENKRNLVDTKTEVKADTKTETKPETKAEVKAEAKTESKPAEPSKALARNTTRPAPAKRTAARKHK